MPLAMLATPGISITTRKGSPMVPGTSRSSCSRRVTRETSVRSRSPRTTVSYGFTTSGSSAYTTSRRWPSWSSSLKAAGLKPGAVTRTQREPGATGREKVPSASALTVTPSHVRLASDTGRRVPLPRTRPVRTVAGLGAAAGGSKR